MTTGPMRRPGVTRVSSGQVAPLTQAPVGTAAELDPTGPVPRVGRDGPQDGRV
jgi:hypothetical protein